MLWQLLLTIASIVTSPFRGHVDPDHPFEPTPHGPQSWQEEIRARRALQGDKDDIRYHDEDEPSYAGINDTTHRWPGYPGGGTVPYVLDTPIAKNKTLVKLIDNAISQYHKHTCIRFVKRTNELNYIKIIRDDGCYSYVGLISPLRPQPLSLGEGCEFVGTIVHELGHAIGLFHEHQRSDRDQYINVYFKNIFPNMTDNFDKTKPIDELKWATYDYTSIMHYGEYAFSMQDKVLKSMEAKDGKTTLLEPYDKPGLNRNDIDLVKKLYKCK